MRQMRWIRGIGTIAALGTLAFAAVAQGMGGVTVHVTGSGTVESFLVPAQPNYLSLKITGAGQDPSLGAATALAHIRAPLDPQGRPVAGRDGLGVITLANGDRLFVVVDAIARQVANAQPGDFTVHGVFVVTGGTGRLAAASGSGTLDAQGNLIRGEYTYQLDGTIVPLGG